MLENNYSINKMSSGLKKPRLPALLFFRIKSPLNGRVLKTRRRPNHTFPAILTERMDESGANLAVLDGLGLYRSSMSNFEKSQI